MRFSYPLRMSVIKRGDKEQKLAAFVATYFSQAPNAQDILLIARSIDSPVVKAIAAAAPQVAAAGCSVRIILAQADREALPESWTIGGTVPVDCELRWARNRRLLEAHEQLVMGSDFCWTGDSMRRDPAKCDAYETFVEGDRLVATSSRVSFERLWAASEPLLPQMPPPASPIDSAAAARGA
jgi:hypothetical protein